MVRAAEAGWNRGAGRRRRIAATFALVGHPDALGQGLGPVAVRGDGAGGDQRGITAQVLLLGACSNRAGKVILAAAVIDDVLCLLALACERSDARTAAASLR